MPQLHHSTHVQKLLNDHAAGVASARAALLEYTLERFRIVAQRMFRQERTLHALDQTDDVVQKGLIRLHKALETITPADAGAFFGLAARQLRFVIADLAEEMHTRRRLVSMESVAEPSAHQPGQEPASFLEWSEFHEAVGRLPDEERVTFDLLYYSGMEQHEAATLLGISERTIRRRWQSAKLMLAEWWK